MSKVFLAKIKENIESAVARLLEEAGFSNGLRGDSILIKPNLFEPVSYTTGQTTNPHLVEAVIKWCFNQGAKEVWVGEGPSYFLPEYALKECFIKTGIAEIVKRCNATWILFDEHPFKTYRDISPFLPKQFGISEHAFLHNKIINIPVPKTHYLTEVSIAMKNLKGFLKREAVTEEVVDKAKRLNEIAKGRGQTLAQMALSWTLRHESRVRLIAFSPSRICWAAWRR